MTTVGTLQHRLLAVGTLDLDLEMHALNVLDHVAFVPLVVATRPTVPNTVDFQETESNLLLNGDIWNKLLC